MFKEKNGEPEKKEKELTKSQIIKGIIILIIFIVLRFIIAQIWIIFFNYEYHLTFEFIFFLIISFLLGSVLLVGFGFKFILKINLKELWFKKGKVLGDIGWAFLAIIALFIISGFFSFIAQLLGLSLPDTTDAELNMGQILINFLLGLFFGFLIASFPEETLFRGFLQRLLTEKKGKWFALFIQALLFSITHFGIDINNSWVNIIFLIGFRFIFGIIFGLLVQYRGNLLSAGIAHGIMG